MNDRQECNKEIVELLSKLVNENPNLKFGQILQSFGLTRDAWAKNHVVRWFDESDTESNISLIRLKDAIQEVNGSSVV